MLTYPTSVSQYRVRLNSCSIIRNGLGASDECHSFYYTDDLSEMIEKTNMEPWLCMESLQCKFT